MNRPAVLDMDLVVVPREATVEMQVSGNFNADQSPEAVFSAMISASLYPTAWDDVRKYVEGMERGLAKANNEFGCQTHTWPDLWRRIADLKEYQRKAELRAAELEAGIKRLSDEEELCAGTTGDDPFSLVYLSGHRDGMLKTAAVSLLHSEAASQLATAIRAAMEKEE